VREKGKGGDCVEEYWREEIEMKKRRGSTTMRLYDKIFFGSQQEKRQE